jgi:integrase
MARRKLAPTEPQPKTGYGNGGVHEEKKGSGRWIAELDGVRRRAHSKAEADEKLRKLQEQRDANIKLQYSSMRFYTWYKLWITPSYSDLKQKTREGYEEVGRLYIEPYKLASTALEDVTEGVLEGWLTALRDKKKLTGEPLAESTLAIAFRRVRRALEVARIKRYITYNPALSVTAPSGAPSRKPIVFEAEQIVRFLLAWDGWHLYPLFALECTTGMRRGELTGLRWQDVDLEKRIINVCGQLQWLRLESGKARRPIWIPTTKTVAGERDLHIPVAVADVLSMWKSRQAEQRRLLESEGKVWEGEDYVFTNEHGRPINPRNLLRSFKKALKRADLPQETTIHHLRHSIGSIMLADGQNIEAVTELLGHSSRGVTEDIYAHALPSKKRETGESLGYLLRREEA